MGTRGHLLMRWATLLGAISILIWGFAPPEATTSCCGGELLDRALAGPMSETADIVFAVRAPGGDGHWYANFGYHSANERQMQYGRDGGRLCRLNLRTGELTALLDDPGGGVRDPQVHYSGEKILFSCRPAGTKYYHLYEIGCDGSELQRITDGPFDDIEPIYLPDGEIVFCSSRCKRWVQCWHTQVAVLYRCGADGSDIRPLSANVEQDNTPWMLPDGRLIYTRWEYVDRSRVQFHHLWTANPDGSGQTVMFGNMHGGIVMIDAKPIPDTNKVLCIFSPGHGRKEHAGVVTIVDPDAGPDERKMARAIGRSNECRDPYPLGNDLFLVAEDSRLLLMDGDGRTETIYSLPSDERGFWCHEPRPLRPRPVEPKIPPRVDPSAETGHLVLADVHHGRNMTGVRPGDIKRLLVLESLAKPVNHSGTMEPISLGGTFTLPRILGTVPVEDDGSAYFEVPALRSLFFVALDENDLSVKRMQSFVTVMPGETTACAGCHEHRADTPGLVDENILLALRRRPHKIEPIRDVPEVFDFVRDIQPILDRHCVKCHNYERRPDGDFPLVGARSPWYSHSYYALMSRGQVSHGRDAGGNRSPRDIGSSASPLMKLLDGSHYQAQLSAHEQAMVRLWIESGAPFAGTYASLGTGMVGPPQLDAKVLQRRCSQCHAGGGLPARSFRGDLLYNLSDAAASPVLLAPLAKRAGGWGSCDLAAMDRLPRPPSGTLRTKGPPFQSTDDPDYRQLLAEIEKTKGALEKKTRFDMTNFRPRDSYIREMKRFGILPESFDPDTDPIDVYETDAAYWQSLWYRKKG